MNKFVSVACCLLFAFAPQAFAQDVAQETSSATEATPDLGNNLRGPSPKILDANRQGFFQLGVGPAYGISLHTDSLMYNVMASYNWNLTERVTAKALADLYLGTGSVSSRMMNYGVGADVYIPEINPLTFGLPYASAQVAYGNGRNSRDETGNGIAVGAGAGFKFQAAQLNWDVSLNYTLLTEEVGSAAPSIVGLRAAVAF